MSSADHIDRHASDLLDAAHALHSAARQPGGAAAAAAALGSLEEALLVLSAGWQHVAADAVPEVVRRDVARSPASPQADDDLSREQRARLVGTLHDVAASFAHCARACREARSTVAPLVERRSAVESPSVSFPRFERHNRPTGLAA